MLNIVIKVIQIKQRNRESMESTGLQLEPYLKSYTGHLPTIKSLQNVYISQFWFPHHIIITTS